MTTRKMVQVHVAPFFGVGWQVKVNSRRVSRFASQQEAEACAIFLSRLMAPSTLKLHKRNGRIREERTFDRKDDPKKTRG